MCMHKCGPPCARPAARWRQIPSRAPCHVDIDIGFDIDNICRHRCIHLSLYIYIYIYTHRDIAIAIAMAVDVAERPAAPTAPAGGRAMI